MRHAGHTDPAQHARRRTGRQSLPARRRARRARRDRAAPGPRAARPRGSLRRTAALEGRIPRMTPRWRGGRLCDAWPRARAGVRRCLAAAQESPPPPRRTASPQSAPTRPDAAAAARSTSASATAWPTRNARPAPATRWRQHFANAPRRMAARTTTCCRCSATSSMPCAKPHLPTEYALIPFVESGYKPGARSASGPAGLWQMIAITARNHGVPMRAGYDGRLSPVDSTQAAVRYLKTLHGMFAGDWRLAVMAYNAGEYRVLGALQAQRPERANAQARTNWSACRASPRPTCANCMRCRACSTRPTIATNGCARSIARCRVLAAATVAGRRDQPRCLVAARRASDAGLVRRMNPAFADGRIARRQRARCACSRRSGAAPACRRWARSRRRARDRGRTPRCRSSPQHVAGRSRADPQRPSRARTRCARGESAWIIAQRYGARPARSCWNATAWTRAACCARAWS